MLRHIIHLDGRGSRTGLLERFGDQQGDRLADGFS